MPAVAPSANNAGNGNVKPIPGRAGWQFWIDRGGNLYRCARPVPAGPAARAQGPSVAPGTAGGDPGLQAVQAILAAAGGAAPRIDVVKVGTTVATNALLTRGGEPVVLVTTAGFADGLRIGYQNRPDIFARHIVLPGRCTPRSSRRTSASMCTGGSSPPWTRGGCASHLAGARGCAAGGR